MTSKVEIRTIDIHNRWVAPLLRDQVLDRLLPLAKAKLSSRSQRLIDEEDVLISVFDRFFVAAKAGRFGELNNRTDLWQILLMLTERKVIDQYRRDSADKRGSVQTHTEAELPLTLDSLQELADKHPSPEMVSTFNDSLDWAINRLGNKTRDVALLRLEGYSNREIAQKLDIGLSTVERKLRVIREVWQKQDGQIR